MKEVRRGIGAGILILVLGAGATYIFNRVYIRFKSVAIGSIRKPPDGRGTFNSYKASDGVNVCFDRLEFPSADAARDAFHQVLIRSSKIIERGPLRDRGGKAIVGERVVAIFPSDDGRQWPMVVSLDGANLYEISSTSLRHLALFEKARRRY